MKSLSILQAEADGHRRKRRGQKTCREGGVWAGWRNPSGGSSTRAVSGILCEEGLQPQTWAVSVSGLRVHILLRPVFAPIGIYPIYKCINGSHLKIHPEMELAMGFFFFPLTKMKILYRLGKGKGREMFGD